MKNTNLCGLLICSAAMLINNGCAQDNTLYNATPINTPPTTQNINLKVFAGEDIQAILSFDSRFLILGGYYFARGTKGEIINLNNVKIQWEKKSGPSSYKLEHPDSIRTKVSDLEKGIYEFELTVTTDNELTVKDTVRFTVGSISENSKEIVFENKIWLPIWHFNIVIENFNLLIPQNNFKVYIQRDNNLQWEEATPFSDNLINNLINKYDYFIETRPDGAGMYNYGSLYISYYGPNPTDTPNVKIAF